jgi:SAM-dependent methyltransferase
MVRWGEGGVSAAAKHREGRDVPVRRERSASEFKKARKGTREERTVADLARLTRVRKEDGGSFENRAQGSDPRRPPFCMLFEDFGDQVPGVYGMFPASFIPKILPWLRCERREILHVCSGGLPRGEGIRVDIRPEAKPDIVADGRALPLEDASVAAVLIDPPYSEHYARELYGTDYPRPSHLLREAVRVVRPNGRFAIVHYIVPNPPGGGRFIRAFGLSMGFGYPMRAVTIFERQSAPLRFEGPR